MAETSNQNNCNNCSWAKFLASKTVTVAFVVIAWIALLCRLIFYVLKRLFIEIHAMEQLFLKMGNIFAFISQILFFTMTEIAILGEPTFKTEDNKQGIRGISALLFYCVIGYFVTKIREIFEGDWSRNPHIQYSTSQYVKWIIRILLEWAKSIAVVLCLRDRGIILQLDAYYTPITFMYYVCTERLFIELMIKCVGCFNFEIFDSMEHLYVPLILNIYIVLSSIAVTIYLSTGPHAMYALFASYFILYLRFKDLYYKYIKTLHIEQETYASFRSATDSDIRKWDDICAVCLSSMSNAKITPCNHLFHPFCLKQCLRTSLQCPLCKYDFVQ